MGIVNVSLTENVDIDFWSDGTSVIDASYSFEENVIVLDREEAIAAAKAILKHYDVDFNAYEDNINERYRPLTKAEMEQHLKDNPNLVPVTIDPDAPLTSELAERFKGGIK